MLTKDLRREYVPGTPEVPGVTGGRYCYTPPSAGVWVYSCRQVFVVLNGSTPVPPGAQGPYYVKDNDGRVTAIYYNVCTSQWVPTGPPATPVCTYIEPREHVPATRPRWDVTPRIGWDAGANSVVSHEGDCEAKWTMQMVAGACVGLTHEFDNVGDPDRVEHGFMFHQRAGVPQFRIVESGRARSSDMSYREGDEFAIRRVRGAVSYWHNEERLQDSDVPSVAPDAGGEIVFEGSVPPDHETGSVFLLPGTYTIAEEMGNGCDWMLIDMADDVDIESGIEGSEIELTIEEPVEAYFHVMAYGDGGPFRLRITPHSTQAVGVRLAGALYASGDALPTSGSQPPPPPAETKVVFRGNTNGFGVAYASTFESSNEVCTQEFFDAIVVAESVTIVGMAKVDGNGWPDCNAEIPSGLEWDTTPRPLTYSPQGSGGRWAAIFHDLDWYQSYWCRLDVDGVEYTGVTTYNPG